MSNTNNLLIKKYIENNNILEFIKLINNIFESYKEKELTIELEKFYNNLLSLINEEKKDSILNFLFIFLEQFPLKNYFSSNFLEKTFKNFSYNNETLIYYNNLIEKYSKDLNYMNNCFPIFLKYSQKNFHLLKTLLENKNLINIITEHKEKIFYNIIEIIQDIKYKENKELLISAFNCLDILINILQNNFKQFATVTLYQALDYLTDTCNDIKIFCLNIIYNLIIYCSDEVEPLKNNITELLIVLKDSNDEKIKIKCDKILNEFYSKYEKNNNNNNLINNYLQESNSNIFESYDMEMNIKNTIINKNVPYISNDFSSFLKLTEKDEINDITNVSPNVLEIDNVITFKNENLKEFSKNIISNIENIEKKDMIKKNLNNFNIVEKTYRKNNNLHNEKNNFYLNNSFNNNDNNEDKITTDDNKDTDFKDDSNYLQNSVNTKYKKNNNNLFYFHNLEINKLLTYIKELSNKQILLLNALEKLKNNSSKIIKDKYKKINYLESKINFLTSEIQKEMFINKQHLKNSPVKQEQDINQIFINLINKKNFEKFIEIIDESKFEQLKLVKENILENSLNFLINPEYNLNEINYSLSIKYIKAVLLGIKIIPNDITINNLMNYLQYLNKYTDDNPKIITENEKIDLNYLISYLT